MTAFPSYSTGTIAIATNATSVVGTGSNWTGVNAMPGDLLVVGPDTVIVQDVTDATHLVIDAWPFAAVTAGTAYKIYKVSPLRFVGSQTAIQVDQLVSALAVNGFYVFVPPDASVPDPSLGQDNQYAFQATTGKLWQKTSGTWNFIGIQKGFGLPSAWNSATAYIAFDVVSLNGTSYVCILGNTNQTPPNATYWTVLAAKGDTGSTGSTGPAAWTAPAAWVTSHAYTAGPPANVVTQAGETYVCLTSHTSGTFATDLAAGKWIKIAQKGTGDLLSTNNLSDVASAATARANLGIPPLLRGYISGLTLSNDAVTPFSILDIAAGVATSDDAAESMMLPSAITKTTGSWAVGGGNGGLDTGTVANNAWYHVFLIKRTDTGVVDVLFSTSPTSPTLPTNYSKKRRIGSIRTNGSAQIIAFSQSGSEFLWKVPASDANAVANPGTSAVTPTLTVPSGVQVAAIFTWVLSDNTPSGGTFALITSPDQTDTAPSATAFSALLPTQTSGDIFNVSVPSRIRTNTSGQIRYRLSLSTTDHFVYIVTQGWVDNL